MVQHNTVERANEYVNKKNIQTVITFRTQQLLDLWENEFKGQISDGIWENSHRTDWLWNGTVYVQLGEETKVETTSRWIIGRKTFGMTKGLWDIIGDRIISENDFKNEKEAKKAWREIAMAIFNARVTKEAVELSDKLREEQEKIVKADKESLMEEFKENVDTIDDFGKGIVGRDITVEIMTDPARYFVGTKSYLLNNISNPVQVIESQINKGNLKQYLTLAEKFIKDYSELVNKFKEESKELAYKIK